jgi:excisionase family DNA binding protein
MAVIAVEKQTVTIPELARILGLNTEYVRRELIGRNRIRHLRLSRRMIRVPASAVQEFLASNSEHVPTQRATDAADCVSV